MRTDVLNQMAIVLTSECGSDKYIEAHNNIVLLLEDVNGENWWEDHHYLLKATDSEMCAYICNHCDLMGDGRLIK